ncbi:hypothetical protein Ahy_A03g014322 isoform B [Arachis hypogaea]|uniref:Uncharacterized protein n=2 Tax=Arachis hypogaea TaxID=3818 RepID=A0A445DXE9_ARAHY|nr:hypothetical protein Ahy_A03g014322 isoform B [Arachis hypogaea]
MTGFVYQFIRVYQLKILSVGITFGGPTIFRYKDQFKEPIFLAFDSTSWKVLFSLNLVDNVNRVADHLLQSLLGSQVHYYPIDQYRYDLKSFSSFIMAILLSSHHESLKAQKAINGLFVKYNIQFYRVFKSFFRISDKDNHTCGLGFSDLVSQIGSMSFDSTGLYWRPLFEEFEKSTSSDKDTCNFGFEYTLKEITVQAVT